MMGLLYTIRLPFKGVGKFSVFFFRFLFNSQGVIYSSEEEQIFAEKSQKMNEDSYFLLKNYGTFQLVMLVFVHPPFG